MHRIIIVDNEKPALNLLERMLYLCHDVEIIGAFQKPSEVLLNIDVLKPDAVILDIEMPGINGIELALKINEIDSQVDFIFVTAYDHYAVEAFDINAIDYILKPIAEEKLLRSIERLTKKRSQRKITQKLNDEPIVLIKMLGAFETKKVGRQPVRWMTIKVEELFAILLLQKFPISKWALMEMLWPDTPPKKAEQNLYTTIFRLKQTFKEEELDISIKTNKGTYMLQMVNINLDVNLMIEAKSGKGSTNIEDVMEECKGELLEGKDYLWCYELRQSFCNDYCDIAIKAVNARINEGNLPRGIDLLENILKISPNNSNAMRRLEYIASKGISKELMTRITRIESDQSDCE